MSASGTRRQGLVCHELRVSRALERQEAGTTGSARPRGFHSRIEIRDIENRRVKQNRRSLTLCRAAELIVDIERPGSPTTEWKPGGAERLAAHVAAVMRRETPLVRPWRRVDTAVASDSTPTLRIPGAGQVAHAHGVRRRAGRTECQAGPVAPRRAGAFRCRPAVRLHGERERAKTRASARHADFDDVQPGAFSSRARATWLDLETARRRLGGDDETRRAPLAGQPTTSARRTGARDHGRPVAASRGAGAGRGAGASPPALYLNGCARVSCRSSRDHSDVVRMNRRGIRRPIIG